MDSKNTADLHLQVDAFADRSSACTSVPTLPPTSLGRRLLLSKYPTISRYRDTERHDISISSLCYDMNPWLVMFPSLLHQHLRLELVWICVLYKCYNNIMHHHHHEAYLFRASVDDWKITFVSLLKCISCASFSEITSWIPANVTKFEVRY